MSNKILRAKAALLGFSLVSGISPAPAAAELIESLSNTLEHRALTEKESSQLALYIERHPRDTQAHLLLAESYNRLGLDGLYAQEMETAWRLNPDNLIYLLAVLKMNTLMENNSKVESLAEEAFGVYKKNVSKLSTLGLLFRANNHLQVSLKYLSFALKQDPDNQRLRANYCSSLFLAKQYDKLLSESRILARHENSRTMANLLTGTALLKLRRPEQALPYLQSAYTANKSNSEASEAYFDALIELNQTKAALEPALMAIATQPAFSPNLEKLKTKVTPLVKKASKVELESAVQATVNQCGPKQSICFFYFALGDILQRSCKFRTSGKYLMLGINEFPYGRAYMKLAYDLDILGETPADSIFGLYERALELSPGDKEVKNKYLRAKVRMNASSKDIAFKLKNAINSRRYRD